MSSVGWRDLLKYRSVTMEGAEGEIPRYLIDNLIETLSQGTPANLRFLLVPTNSLTANEWCPDLGFHGLPSQVQVTHDVDPALRGSLLSSLFNGTDEWWETPDNALLSAVSAGVDVAFSVGCAFKISAGAATNQHLISKWDDQTPNVEWRLMLSDAEFPVFMLMDDNVALSQRGRNYTTAITINRWNIIIATYDGRAGLTAEEGINIYLYDAVNLWQGAVDDANSNGAGDYVNMEDTAQPVMIGAADIVAGPNPGEWINAEIVLPFMTLGDLSNTRSYSASGGVITEITYAEHAAAIMRRMLALP